MTKTALTAYYVLFFSFILVFSLLIIFNNRFKGRILEFQNLTEERYKRKKNLNNVLYYIVAYITFILSNIATIVNNIVMRFKARKNSKGKVIYADNSNLHQLIRTDIALVEFWGEWCGPCLLMDPFLEQFAIENNEVKVIKVNVKHKNYSNKYGVKNIPQILLFKNGVEIQRNVGPMTLQDLETFINHYG